MMTVKVAVTMFFCSLRPSPTLRWIAIFTTVFSVMGGSGILLFLIFQCKPVTFYWQRVNFEHQVPGTCVSGYWGYILHELFNFSDLVSDVVFSVLPFFLVWSMKLSRWKRFGIAILLSSGVV